jgi:perosamine synthetase
MHEQPVLQKMGFLKDADLPIAAKLARRGFYIPSGMALREDQIREVAGIVAEVIR